MIQHHLNNLPEILFNLGYILISVLVSVVFWRNCGGGFYKKLFTAAHSVSLLILLGIALILGFNGFTGHMYYSGFVILLLVPLASIFYSFKSTLDGKKTLLLHVWNVFSICVTWFIGGMATTGDWL